MTRSFNLSPRTCYIPFLLYNRIRNARGRNSLMVKREPLILSAKETGHGRVFEEESFSAAYFDSFYWCMFYRAYSLYLTSQEVLSTYQLIAVAV